MEALNWELLKSFLAVIKHGSLSGAARALGATQPTIGRHIKSLEDTFQRTLFVRSRDGLTPTSEALDLLPHAETMAGALAALVRTASGEEKEETGTIRLAASEIMGVEILPGMLTRFRQDYPNISIELVISNRIENLLKRDADIALRMLRPTQAALIAKKIGESPIGLFAHKAYLAKHGKPLSLVGLGGHAAIGPDGDVDILRHLSQHGVTNPRESFSLRTDNQLAQLALLKAGAGIGGTQISIAQKDKNLLQILKDEFCIPMEIWLVMHEDLKSIKRIRVLFDFLVRELKEWVSAT